MSILTVENLSHSFGGREIFDNVSFRLLKGEKIGLIGANGEGKSTFMKIITDKLIPDEGKIIWSKRVRSGYLDQSSHLEKGSTIFDNLKLAYKYLFDIQDEITDLYMKMADPDQDMDQLLEAVGELQSIIDSSDFYLIDSKIEQVAKGLGFYDLGLDKDVSELSGGQRTRVLLAKLLLEKPDILLLDEPTNYLDEDHINWLRNYLINYENAFILISHDIEFLDSVINIIYHVDNNELNRYVGNYDLFVQNYEMKQRQLEAKYNKQQQEIRDLKDFVARNKASVATRNMAMSRQKKLDKMDIIELKKEKPKPIFNFNYSKAPAKELFILKDLVIGYESALSKPLNFIFLRGEKVALTGSNGIGKTTLLRSLIGQIKPFSGNVEVGVHQDLAYFAQEVNDYNDKTCLDYFWDEYPSFNQAEVRGALARCGLTTDHIESKAIVLSGGEQAKLRLALIMNRESNILILDEPTNHLDIEAKQELKNALKNYKGSIILISHDPIFYEDIVDKVINIEEFTTKLL